MRQSVGRASMSRKGWRRPVLKSYRIVGALALVLLGSAPSVLQAQPCNSTLPTLTSGSGTVVNTYYSAFMPGAGSTNTAAAGAQNVRIDNGLTRGAAVTLAAGDMLIVMQMQDAGDQQRPERGLRRRRCRGSRPGVDGRQQLRHLRIRDRPGRHLHRRRLPGRRHLHPHPGRRRRAERRPRQHATWPPRPSATRGRRTFQVIRVPRYASGTLVRGPHGLGLEPGQPQRRRAGPRRGRQPGPGRRPR